MHSILVDRQIDLEDNKGQKSCEKVESINSMLGLY